MEIISCENVIKLYESRFGNKVLALSGIDLNIKKGDFISIIGPSGSGKTTLLKLIAGFDKPTIGTIHILGKELIKLNPLYKKTFLQKNIGFVKQNPNEMLSLDLTTLDNVLYASKFRNQKTSIKEIRELLALTGIKEKENLMARFLSIGEKMRLTIAISLIHKPKILLLDEPTGLLDSSTMYQILSILNNINKQGLTIISVTHDTGFFYSVNKTYLLENGRIASIERRDFTKNGLELSLSSLVDKAGFVQIPLMIREKLHISDLVLFSLCDNHKKAIIENPVKKIDNRDIGLEEVTRALDTILSSHTKILIDINIQKYPKNDLTILHNIKFVMKSGEFVVVMGPSGSGKSSLLGIISGYIKNFLGERIIEKNVTDSNNFPVNNTYQPIFIPHDPFIHPEYTIWHNLLNALHKRTEETILALKTLLRYLNVDNRINAYPYQLSGGEYQRITTLLGIILSPAILLIDEPTTHLNTELRDKLMNILEIFSKRNQKGVIISTHDPNCLRKGQFLLKLQNGAISNIIKLEDIDISNERKLFYKSFDN